MPLGNETAPICGKLKVLCHLDVIDKFRNPDVPIGHSERLLDSCNCLPACNTLSYTAEVSSQDVIKI